MTAAPHESITVPQTNYEEQIRIIMDKDSLGYVYGYPDKRLYSPLEEVPTADFIESAWQGYEGPIGVYVHVPWCTPKPPTEKDDILMKTHDLSHEGRDHLCSYCNLYTAVRKGGAPTWYADSISSEARLYEPTFRGREGKINPQSLYFGGGSPSLLDVSQMEQIIKSIAGVVGPVEDQYERAIEVIPDSVDQAKLAAMRRIFNRISVGVQTFDQTVLRNTGRAYDASLAMQTIQNAIAAGFTDINGDLIAGLQGSNRVIFMNDVLTMADAGVSTITLYQNMIRPGTRAGRMASKHLLEYDAQQQVVEQIQEAHDILTEKGFNRLSLTCWSKTKGYQQGEQIYERVPILGFGPGARSYGPHGHYALPYTEDVRLITNAIARWHSSIENGEFPNIHGVVLTEDIKRRSVPILGLMSQQGIEMSSLERNFPEQFQALLSAQLLHVVGDRAMYTEKGKSLSGAMASLFYSPQDLEILVDKNSIRSH